MYIGMFDLPCLWTITSTSKDRSSGYGNSAGRHHAQTYKTLGTLTLPKSEQNCSLWTGVVRRISRWVWRDDAGAV
jgi:hypothetical protein